MKFINNFNLPEPVALALSEDTYSQGPSERSVTQLIDSPRIRILYHEYDDQIVEDVSERLWVALGRAMHTLFENYATGKYVSEERLFADIDGWTVSGAIDIQHGNTLIDYKMTSVWSVIYGKQEWINQLNFYAWLAEQCKGITVEKLQILAVLRDWKQRDLETRGTDYPPAPIMLLNIPLWTVAEREVYVHERVRIHQEAEFSRLTGDPLPLCSDAERWKDPDTYAVMKGKNKRAVRVYTNEDDALNHVADNPDQPLRIVKRRSMANRCERYCKAAPWCEQYQSENV